MSNDRDLIERYFAAMRRGAAAEDEMMALFSEDAVYVEPFTGETDPWVGKEAVRTALRRGWEQPLPDLELNVRRIDITGGRATSEWICTSSALPGPVHGRDEYTIVDGKITRLAVKIVEPEET
ncbi:MAG: nuclear transport factor 2 family protein [Acidimicrobiia bacterium]|nr:nuclear transport factor 2 family protein [Acidimicrobiia bacterium]